MAGSAVAAWIGSLIVWWQLVAALRESEHMPGRMATIRWPRRRNRAAGPEGQHGSGTG